MEITQSQEFILTQAFHSVGAAVEAEIRHEARGGSSTAAAEAVNEAQRTALFLAVDIVAGDACPDNLSTRAGRHSSGRTVPFPAKGFWSSSAEASWDELVTVGDDRTQERYLDVRAQLVVKAAEGDVTTPGDGRYTQWTDGTFTHVLVSLDIDNEYGAFTVVRPVTKNSAFWVEDLIPVEEAATPKGKVYTADDLTAEGDAGFAAGFAAARKQAATPTPEAAKTSFVRDGVQYRGFPEAFEVVGELVATVTEDDVELAPLLHVKGRSSFQVDAVAKWVKPSAVEHIGQTVIDFIGTKDEVLRAIDLAIIENRNEGDVYEQHPEGSVHYPHSYTVKNWRGVNTALNSVRRAVAKS